MATLALRHSGGAISVPRSLTHRLALALVWLTVASGAVVATEPAPIDVLTIGLIVLLPLVGLVAIRPPLLALLAMLLIGGAAGVLAATNATDIVLAMTHTGVTLYLYLATFIFAAFIARRPQAHAALVLNAYTWAALVAAGTGIIGYFDLVDGTHEAMTRFDRAVGLFKDPNVFGPFLVPAFLCALTKVTSGRLLSRLFNVALLPTIGFAILLSFSRGAWLNLAIATTVYGVFRIATLPTAAARLRLAALAVAGTATIGSLVLVALQFDAIANVFDERATLTQSYDEGPEGRFGGQEKAAELMARHPLGIGAQQFVPQYHHEEPHNVYLAMFLNAGWIGGLVFIALVGGTALLGFRHALLRTATQPIFLAVYACIIGHAVEGALIDLDHWRHFYLLIALAWGLMLGQSQAVPVRRAC